MIVQVVQAMPLLAYIAIQLGTYQLWITLYMQLQCACNAMHDIACVLTSYGQAFESVKILL
eukprot:SAG11_NODE_27644_length_330_cov_1.346320_1_plen_61_part_00